MPEVTVRKRLGRRSGGAAYKARRWLYYRRAQLAVWFAALSVASLAMVAWIVVSKAANNVNYSEEAVVPATQ